MIQTEEVPAGAWRVRTDVVMGDLFPNNGIGPDVDFLRCHLDANGIAIDGGATELFTSESYLKGVVNAGSFTSSSSWTLTLSCSHDDKNTSGGKWTALYGGLVAVDKGPIN
ncbi:MAG: hypothetical protein ACR2MN_03740 [Acidimicrobiales bacterium]